MFDSLNKFFFNPRHLSNGIYYIQYPIPKRRHKQREGGRHFDKQRLKALQKK